MLQKNKILPVLIISLSLSACDFFKFKTVTEEDLDDQIVATVGNQKLKRSELKFLTFQGNDVQDSMNISRKYIQNWVQKQLMIKEAGKSMAFDEAELNRKLLDYRYALMVYEYEKSYVESHSIDEINTEDILAYYESHKENFNLKEIIVRANYFKLEKNSNQKRNLERLLNRNAEDPSDLKQFALDHADNYYLEDSTWVIFDEIIVGTPISDNNNKVQLLRNNKLIKAEDDTFTYYFKILEYKLQDQVPPVEFVKDEISAILRNKKRLELVEKLQKEIYTRAEENNEFKIYE
ncbi:peptidyl-prolyl cis-trans isomerase [Belliella kenyensis]|uniref:Peptidyl-prolyl cis-trans isomerase n=1 Tax=Belliella kenyensis TaxID=1472724 RepID=A0ABV8ESE5_9BACT|nr:peptidyl-prolyl cis-trans isomerase [Belliella kenyensis]MCH7402565.1 peptidyl-prolyl cis-trans isomerase [Belliella kenyensis]MDN3603363.1 peptidyl-prolyl cis-trans isomerase [Belliella kenyensis]